MNKTQEIGNLLTAKYRLIYIDTFEEQRTISTLRDVASKLDMKLIEWSFASGIHDDSLEELGLNDPLAGDPMSILQLADDLKDDTIIVLKDYHSFLKDAEVVRGLKDVINEFRDKYIPIIITAPIVKLPIEIEKEVALVEFPLPDKEYIKGIVESVLKITNTSVSEEKLMDTVNSCSGLTTTEIENVISKSIVTEGQIDPKFVLLEKKSIIKKNGILEYIDATEGMEDIGGIHSLKTWLKQRKAAFTDEAKEFGLPTPKGLLLTGVPGCGKSMVCKAVSNLWKMPLLKLDMGSIMNSLVGSSEENMRKVLDVSEAISPCILWIDEIEKALSGTKSSNFSDGGTTSRLFATFLSWMQDKDKPVFVIATANDLTQLPSELLRRGRFDDLFFVDLPDTDEREEIFRIHISKRGRDPQDFNIKTLAKESLGYSGAEIEQAIIDALYEAFANRAQDSDITDLSIARVLRDLVPLSKTKETDIKQLRFKASTMAKSAK